MDASIKKWGGTPSGFADTLLQSVIDSKAAAAAAGSAPPPAKMSSDLLDQAETAISKVQLSAGVVSAQVVARIDSAVRFVCAGEDLNATGFELSRVRAWVNEIDDDIAGEAGTPHSHISLFAF